MAFHGSAFFNFPGFIIFLLVVQVCSAVELTLTIDDDPLRSPSVLAFRPKPSGPRVDIEIGKITKALWDSGFKVMSLMLERNLKEAIPDQEFEDGNNSTITLYNNKVITIFVPIDGALCYKRFFPCSNFGYQIVASKVDKKLFSSDNVYYWLPNFDTSLGSGVYAHTTFHWGHGENGEIIEWKVWCINNNVQITNWDIYNDGHVIVHGVDGFFNKMAGYNIGMFNWGKIVYGEGNDN